MVLSERDHVEMEIEDLERRLRDCDRAWADRRVIDPRGFQRHCDELEQEITRLRKRLETELKGG